MTLLVPQTGSGPVPVDSVLSKPYWDGCTSDQLLVQRCRDCGGLTHPAAIICVHCCSRAIDWDESEGVGLIVSWTTVWRPQTPKSIVPYCPIVVELSEGWRMPSAITECDHEEVYIGLPVEVWFHPLSGAEGVKVPYFRPRWTDKAQLAESQLMAL
jgi:uncharacterized OB-fold protein